MQSVSIVAFLLLNIIGIVLIFVCSFLALLSISFPLCYLYNFFKGDLTKIGANELLKRVCTTSLLIGFSVPVIILLLWYALFRIDYLLTAQILTQITQAIQPIQNLGSTTILIVFLTPSILCLIHYYFIKKKK